MTGDPKQYDALLLFGKIARKHRFVLPDDLEECLAIQEKLRLIGGEKKLGEVLVDQGYLTADHVTWILGRQGTEIVPEEASLFGDLAVLNGFVRRGAVDKALKTQKKDLKRGSTFLRIGELLVGDGEMTPQEREAILSLQSRLRAGKEGAAKPPRAPAFLVLEAGPMARSPWGRVILILAVILILVVLFGLIFWAAWNAGN
ncbi:MAG: hypothetical protein ACYTHM_12345 [Planctomycetota bacterium]|jgi:hypothetical protein